MKKNELMNGDVVQLRNGELGIVILDKEQIVYQNIGVDDFDLFDDDLCSEDGNTNYDIIKVYREAYIGFYLIEEEWPIYERNDGIKYDPKQDYNKEITLENNTEYKENNDQSIEVMVQAIYGNRMGMRIHRDEVDRILLGCLSNEFKLSEPLDRCIIHIPNSEHLVMIYNLYREQDAIKRKQRLFEEEGYILKPLANIPELNIELYSRPLVCRMDHNGELQSLKEEDYPLFVHYLRP